MERQTLPEMTPQLLSLERFDALSHSGALFIDLNAPDQLYLGQKLHLLLGLTDAPRHTLNAIVYADDIPLLISLITRVAPPEHRANISLRYLHQDGHLLHVQAQALWVFAHDHAQATGLYLSHVYTPALEQAQLKLRQLYERTPALLHSIDPQGCIEFVSDMWLKSFGYTRQEVVGRRSLEFLTPQGQELARELVPSFFELGYCEDVPYEWRCKDGQFRHVLLSATVERDAHGQIVRSLAILHDVSALRRAEHKELQERQLRAMLFDQAQDAILLKDPNRHILTVNAAAEALFGWSEQELVGQSAKILYEVPALFELNSPLLQTSLSSRQISYKRKDGSTFFGESVWGRLADARGELSGYIEIVRVLDATAQTVHQLELTNKQLAINLESLEQFAYIASHDLRTPLRGIQHIVRFIEEDSPPEVVDVLSHRITQLKERTAYMDRMIQALLIFARSDHHKTDQGLIDLQELIAQLSESLRLGMVGARTFSISCELTPPLTHSFYGHQISLKHILTNLINNSVYHHDQEHATITVRVSEEDGYHCFEVEDDGPGIPEKHHKRIFQIFQTLQKKSDSIGLGLALVQRLVTRSGGSLTLVSPLPSSSRGCLFRFTMPTVEDAP